MHRCSVFKNSCLNVPVDPISKMPKTAYERNEKTLNKEGSIESSYGSISAVDVDAEKLKDFYRSIPDYNDINHLSETEFYSTLKSLREKKKLMLGLAVENIDDCAFYIDRFDKEQITCTKNISRPTHRKKKLEERDCPQIALTDATKVIDKSPHRKSSDAFGVNNIVTNIEKDNTEQVQLQIEDTTKSNTLSTKGISKLDRPKRNHSACSISWHDDKIDCKDEVDAKFDNFFDTNKYLSKTNEDGLYKTQSMPSSPLRMRRSRSGLRQRKYTTVPKPFKMTVRDQDDRIVSDLRSLQKSFSEDMLHQKRERKGFRANPVPIESRIPLYDKILEDQAMRRAITKINSEAELRAQMKPFSFTKRAEAGTDTVCERAVNVLPKSKKKKRFRARPIPKNLFSNYFYDKTKEDNFFRTMNRRIRAEEMLRSSSFPGSMAARDRSRLSTPAAHSDLPIDPSPAIPSISSSARHCPSSPSKNTRKFKHSKEDFITTSPQPFHFNTADRASKKMKDMTKKIYQDSKSSVSGTVEKADGAFDISQAYSALDLKGIAAGRSNLAALLRAEAVRQKFELEAAGRIAEQRRRAENRQRDRLLRSKPAWHLVKNNHEEDIAMRLQTRRDEERMRREEFLHEMELMYGRVQQQPMLFERYYAPRSGAATTESILLSPRKSPSRTRKRNTNKKSYQITPCISPEMHGDFIKYLDKLENTNNVDRNEQYPYREGIMKSLERS